MAGLCRQRVEPRFADDIAQASSPSNKERRYASGPTVKTQGSHAEEGCPTCMGMEGSGSTVWGLSFSVSFVKQLMACLRPQRRSTALAAASPITMQDGGLRKVGFESSKQFWPKPIPYPGRRRLQDLAKGSTAGLKLDPSVSLRLCLGLSQMSG